MIFRNEKDLRKFVREAYERSVGGSSRRGRLVWVEARPGATHGIPDLIALRDGRASFFELKVGAVMKSKPERVKITLRPAQIAWARGSLFCGIDVKFILAVKNEDFCGVTNWSSITKNEKLEEVLISDLGPIEKAF